MTYSNHNAVSFTPTSFNGTRPAHETNDCAVRALMTVTGSTYMAAHAHLADTCGRKDRKGTTTHRLTSILDGGEILGSTFERVLTAESKWSKGAYRKQGTKALKTLCKTLGTGSFYCLMRGHAFAIVDGALVDTWRVPAGSKVFAAWKVVAAAPIAKLVGGTAAAIIEFLNTVGQATIADIAAHLAVNPRTVRAALLYGSSASRFTAEKAGRSKVWSVA